MIGMCTQLYIIQTGHRLRQYYQLPIMFKLSILFMLIEYVLGLGLKIFFPSFLQKDVAFR